MPFIPPFGSPPGGAAGATIELDNLGTTAINTSLISDTDSTDDLGSSSVFWANLFADKWVIPSGVNTVEIFGETESDFGRVKLLPVGANADIAAKFVVLSKGSFGSRITATASSRSLTLLADTTPTLISEDSHLYLQPRTDFSIIMTSQAAAFIPASDSAADLGSTVKFFDETFTDELILTNVGAANASADKLVLSAIDLSAGNTILDINTEGTGVTGSGTPAADRTVAIRVNGTVLYLLASTAAT